MVGNFLIKPFITQMYIMTHFRNAENECAMEEKEKVTKEMDIDFEKYILCFENVRLKPPIF